MAVSVQVVTVEVGSNQYTYPLISMMDRRVGKPTRRVWALVRATEQVLFEIGDSRSTGRFKSHLDACGFPSFVACAAAVEEGVLKESELTAGARRSTHKNVLNNKMG